MKKLLIALCLLLCLTLATPAMAEMAPIYATTAAAVEYMNENGVTYQLHGVDNDGDELVRVSFSNDAGDFVAAIYFFDSLDMVQIYVWNVINYDADNVYDIYRVCNELNYKYRTVKFYADTSDNTVTAQLDLVCSYSEEGKADFQAAFADCLYYIDAIVEAGYPSLEPYGI